MDFQAIASINLVLNFSAQKFIDCPTVLHLKCYSITHFNLLLLCFLSFHHFFTVPVRPSLFFVTFIMTDHFVTDHFGCRQF